MSNYLILSHKPWNKSLISKMSSIFPEDNWFFIDNKDDFNTGSIKNISPAYIFIPHWSYIIEREIYENYNCIVFHMTDLPFGRGGSPLQNLISRGFSETKISAINPIKLGSLFLEKPFIANYLSTKLSDPILTPSQ